MKQTTKRVAAVLLASVVLTAATGAVLLKTRWAEERARLFVQDALTSPSSAIVMDRLGDFEMFSPFGVLRGTAENLRIVNADGTDLLQVGEVTADVDLWRLLRSELRVPTATISAAQVHCDIRTGRPNLPKRPARRTAFEPRSMDLVIDDLEIVGLYAVATKADGSTAILGRLTGRIDLTASGDEPGVKMHLWGLKGALNHPRQVVVHDATGTIDTSADTVADIKFSADSSGASLTGRLWYIPADTHDPVKIDIENVRELDPSVLGNPLDALRGAGAPVDLMRTMGPPPRRPGSW